MARTYSPFGIVTLPRVDANGAIALAKAVESAAAEQASIEPNVTAALTSVTTKRGDLQTAKGAGGSTTTVQDADHTVDDAACALYSLLLAWARLAEYIPEGKTAQMLVNRLFGDGVAFVNYKVEKEWSVIASILKAIAEEDLEPALVSLGAGPMLAQLKKAHEDYGVAIGVTKAEAESPEVGVKRDALLDALRLYVVRVAGTVVPGDQASEAKVNAMLRPITEWRVEKAKPKSKDEATPSKDAGGGGGVGTPGSGTP